MAQSRVSPDRLSLHRPNEGGSTLGLTGAAEAATLREFRRAGSPAKASAGDGPVGKGAGEGPRSQRCWRRTCRQKRNEAIRTRSPIVVGETAARLARDYRPARQLIAAAVRGSTPDVEARLTELAGREDALWGRVEFVNLWERWRKMRALDGSLAAAWTKMKTLLVATPQLSDEVFEEVCSALEARVAEWEALVGYVHPVGQLLTMTSPGGGDRSPAPHLPSRMDG